ncbi:beta-lactamase/transpeptidase-like protein [Irpex rosettiformis]|uniref:Beta-lactamase/transpeptidase-like protein n=1 Tax=Irpex rosettiformis TaxID=378272 RepID=A0ACB8U146_9APHY|nr:beta-lactamase/transpeptidase-like protein [Irpex rosettiformis]
MASYKQLMTTVLAVLCAALTIVAQQQQFATKESSTAHATGRHAFTPELRKFIEDLRQNGSIPGLSVAAIHSEGRVELESFGTSTEDGDELKPETLFNLASCSKAFLAGSVGILIDDFSHGRNVTPLPAGLRSFDWDTKVKDLLADDDWRLMDEWASEKSSIRDILSHVSGLPRHDLSYGPSDKPIDVIRRLRYLRPSFELREKFQYNNQMFMLTSHIISLYSGKPYIEFVRERIFSPLDMSTTTFSESEALKSGLLTHSFNIVGRRLPFWFPDSVKVLNAGPGGVISSTHDLTRWVQMLLNGGIDPATNKTILTASTMEAVTSAHSIVSQAPFPEFSLVGYGLGWFRYSYQGHEIVRHSGAIPGFSTEIAFLPHDGVGVVVLANASDKPNQAIAIVYRIIETILGLSHTGSSRYAGMQSENTSATLSPSESKIASSWKLPQSAMTVEETQHGSDEDYPLEKYIGTYTNPGYHNVTICSPHQLADSSALDPVCRDTLCDFSYFDDLSATLNTTLYLAIPNTWVRSARLVRLTKKPYQFNMTFTYLFPHGYGKNESPFELNEKGEFIEEAQFVVNKEGVAGFGMSNNDVTEVTERQRRGGSVKDMAGVWFEKL